MRTREQVHKTRVFCRMRLQSEILRVIRGKLTASALSRKLGYKFNQFSRWESGEKRLLWTDFVAICKVRRLPLREQIILFLGYEGDLLDTAALTKTLLGGKSIDEASKATKLDRSRISRWLRGKAPPTFLDIYTLLGSTVNVLSFLEPIVNLQEVPILAADYAVLRQQRELAFALPYLDALMEAMIVRRYMELNKHDSKALGAIAGIPAEAVDRALTALEAVGMVEKKSGKYSAIEIGIDYRVDRSRMMKVLLHWLNETTRALGRLGDKPLDGSLVAFSVFSLSRENHEKALSLFREFNRAIHTLGSEEQGPKEKVFVLTNALMDAARFGGT
ncbi:MAG: DUF4423 domain-containing protein [Bdellovibrionota bacterium]